MRFKYEIVREVAPVKHVTVHLTPQDVKTITSLLTNRFPELVDDPSSVTYTFNQILKEIRNQ